MLNEPLTIPDIPTRNLAEQPAPSSFDTSKIKQRDHFLRLMLAGPSAEPVRAGKAPQIQPMERLFHRLPQSRLNPKAGYHLPERRSSAPVQAKSPAIEVMTDLRLVEAVTIRRFSSIEEANKTMVKHGVRALFVVDDQRRMLGFVTSSDIMGEKPMQITQQRGVHHDEVTVLDIMTPADRLEVIDLNVVLNAQVGDVVETLMHAGRQHALVVDQSDAGKDARQMVRGLFSLTQIARQLGVDLQIAEAGHTFAEIESAIGP